MRVWELPEGSRSGLSMVVSAREGAREDTVPVPKEGGISELGTPKVRAWVEM